MDCCDKNNQSYLLDSLMTAMAKTILFRKKMKSRMIMTAKTVRAIPEERQRMIEMGKGRGGQQGEGRRRGRSGVG